MQTDMTGKVALVTGGAGGIGEFICERLAQAGGTVLMLDVDESKAKETLGRLGERLGAAAQRIQFVLGDLNDLQATDQLAQDLIKRHGTIDVLVNNAC
ncbi:MAG: SDR family NAD(P)-dependent oxidoreductase, partial [bacterium]